MLLMAKKCGTAVKLLEMGCEAYNIACDEAHKAAGKPFISSPFNDSLCRQKHLSTVTSRRFENFPAYCVTNHDHL